MIWTVLQSFRNSKEIIFEPWNFPSSLLWENYSNALISLNVATYFLNSVIVTTTSLALGVLLASMIAYVLARYDSSATASSTTICCLPWSSPAFCWLCLSG